MNLNISRNWLLRMADKEANGIISVGGLVARIEREEARRTMDNPTTDQPPPPRTCDCGTPLPDTPLVRAALALWDEVDHYGNLHVYVEDGNLEDHYILAAPDHPDCLSSAESGPRKFIRENGGGAAAARIRDEERLLGLLEAMTEAERFACYGTCMGCREEFYRQHGMWVEDGDEDGDGEDK
jgi:hypothetical protein